MVPESVSLPVLNHQICNFHIKNVMSCMPCLDVLCEPLSSQSDPEITKITSSIDATTEPHVGRYMASVDLHAQVQTGCVATKGTKLCSENVSD